MVPSANGLRGLAPPSPPLVIARRGPRGVAAEVRPGWRVSGAERARAPRLLTPTDWRTRGREGGRGQRPGGAGSRPPGLAGLAGR